LSIKSIRFSAVVTACEDADFIFFDLLDQPVFLVDAAGPASGKLVLERFGLAGAGERVTLDSLVRRRRFFWFTTRSFSN
jgi:hypothetical protein